MSIFNKDWFNNRTETGKYIFDKSGAIYDFSNNSVSKTLYGNKIKELFYDPRLLERECESLNFIISNNKSYASVSIHKKNLDCYTDGSRIVISGLPLKKYSETGLDLVLGFLTHESSHIRFTDFIFGQNEKLNKIIKWIWNVLEDEVIEEMLQIEKPGLGNLLGPVKDYMFYEKENPKFNDEIDEILYIFFNLIRYPENLKKLDKNYFIKYEELFNDIYNILESNNVLNIDLNNQYITKQNLKSAKEIFELLKEYFPEEQMKNKFGNGEPENSEAFKDIKTMIGDSVYEQQTGNNKDIKAKIKDLLDSLIEAGDIQIDNTETDFDGIRGNTPSDLSLRKFKQKGDKKLYEFYRNQVLNYIKLIKNINLKNKTKNLSLTKEELQRNGTLDPRCLATAYQGVKNVYQRFGIKTNRNPNKKFNVVVTLDESGSMAGKATRNIVTKLAITFAEAFKNNPDINLWIYGHGDYIVNYISPKSSDYETLTNRLQSGGQNEVVTYNSILNEISRNNDSDILMVNITDSLYLSDHKDIENLLKKWTNKNIKLSLIAINNRFNNTDIEYNNAIYGKDQWGIITNIDNVEQVSNELRKIIKYVNKLSK